MVHLYLIDLVDQLVRGILLAGYLNSLGVIHVCHILRIMTIYDLLEFSRCSKVERWLVVWVGNNERLKMYGSTRLIQRGILCGFEARYDTPCVYGLLLLMICLLLI